MELPTALQINDGSVADARYWADDPNRGTARWCRLAGQEWAWATDIHSGNVFVGGSQECIDAVVSCADLGALPISPYSPVLGEL